MGSKGQVLAALDTVSVNEAVGWAHKLDGAVAGLKLGLEFFLANGQLGYRRISATGIPIFLDLKLHDIPNTVAGAVKAIAPLQPSILTVHAGGGLAMMQAARESAAEQADKLKLKRPRIVGVTVLTSLDDKDLSAVGQTGPASDQVKRLAELTRSAGLDGIVCSPHEIEALRRDMGEEFLLVVPGVRPSGSDAGDQKRVRTPADAAKAGADYLVIGRPITQAADPRDAASRIVLEVGSALGQAAQ
ncbi:orotidine-5'-phosphate decarboxylase [Dongia sp.]|uniref:orotidine-5'-phosphate decarboxylase n=1 Tax=Dongia sp. TaxID=1977262 RepID=UPI0035B3D51D